MSTSNDSSPDLSVAEPDPEVLPRAKRRKLTAAYKLKVLETIAELKGTGKIGKYLREQGLYHSQVSTWRQAYEEGGPEALEPKRRDGGPNRKRSARRTTRWPPCERRTSACTRSSPRPKRSSPSKKSRRLDRDDPRLRELKMEAVTTLKHDHDIPIARACEALELSRSSYYRAQTPESVESPEREPAEHPRALSAQERAEVLATFDSERFVDQSPYQVYASLLDEGVYL